MKYYTYDYQTKYYIDEIDILEPIRKYDPRIPGNAVPIQPPVTEEGQAAKWNGKGWDIADIPAEIVPEPVQPTREEQIALVIRPIRDQKIYALQDRLDRYHNQVETRRPTTETGEKILQILQVMQQLRDFPETVEDPFLPVWPDSGI